MSSRRFELGTRVIIDPSAVPAIASREYKKEEVIEGKICAYYGDHVGVEFPEESPVGCMGHDCLGRLSNTRGWWVAVNDLSLASPLLVNSLATPLENFLTHNKGSNVSQHFLDTMGFTVLEYDPYKNGLIIATPLCSIGGRYVLWVFSNEIKGYAFQGGSAIHPHIDNLGRMCLDISLLGEPLEMQLIIALSLLNTYNRRDAMKGWAYPREEYLSRWGDKVVKEDDPSGVPDGDDGDDDDDDDDDDGDDDDGDDDDDDDDDDDGDDDMWGLR